MIQHTDINASRASYKEFPGQLLVTRIFNTIQGEGPFGGRPAVFMRLAGCNRGRKIGMGCEFCDTHFAFQQGVPMTYDEILDKLYHAAPHGNLLVITGGEPMLQDNLAGFIRHSYEKQFYGSDDNVIQIESNGDRYIPNLNLAAPGIYLVVSPKVVGGQYRRPKDDVLAHASCFKFVIDGRESDPYYNLPEWHAELEVPVYLSPLTVYKQPHDPSGPVSIWDRDLIDVEATRCNYARARKLAMEYGYIISLQTHLFLETE